MKEDPGGCVLPGERGRSTHVIIKTKYMQKTLSNKYVIGVATLAIVAGSALLMTAADAAETETDTGCRFGGERPELTEEQQAIMEEARSLKEQGLHEEARAESDLPGPPRHMGPRGEGEGPRADVREAVANNDYESFVELTADSPFAGEVNEETFSVMVEAHALMESGDFEGARELMQNAGLDNHRPHKGPQFHSQTTE